MDQIQITCVDPEGLCKKLIELCNPKPSPPPDDKTCDRLLDHYKQVSLEYTEQYKLYIQSWGFIAGSGLIGTFLASDKLVSAIENNRAIYAAFALIIFDIILLLWALLTSWFWAHFIIYRGYLKKLECNISMIPLCNLNNKPIYSFNFYRNAMYGKSGPENDASRIAIFLMSIVYIVIAALATYSFYIYFQKEKMLDYADLFSFCALFLLVILPFEVFKAYKKLCDHAKAITGITSSPLDVFRKKYDCSGNNLSLSESTLAVIRSHLPNLNYCDKQTLLRELQEEDKKVSGK